MENTDEHTSKIIFTAFISNLLVGGTIFHRPSTLLALDSQGNEYIVVKMPYIVLNYATQSLSHSPA